MTTCGLAVQDQLRGAPIQIAIGYQRLRFEVQDKVEVPVVVHVLQARHQAAVLAGGDTRVVSVVMAAFGGRHARTVALTSHHRDGSFVTSVLKAIGVPAVRGSTGHRGGNALREILTTAQDRDIVMTPDGPRGPRRKMSTGTIFLASRSGRAIVPTAFACESSWTIPGSWTSLVIPKPFSKVFLLAGDPIEVPADVSRDNLTQYAAQIQGQMDHLNAQAQRLASGSKS